MKITKYENPQFNKKKKKKRKKKEKWIKRDNVFLNTISGF